MTPVHREPVAGRWFEMPLAEQIANIGSESERTIAWRDRNEKNSTAAFEPYGCGRRGLVVYPTTAWQSAPFSDAWAEEEQWQAMSTVTR